jgi:ADP-ribose pyrophosphatase YjhB (NUDIX family)
VPRATSASRRLQHALLRQSYRVAYRLLGAYAFVLRPRANGVKCVLTHGDEVVLVRHTYGPRRVWLFPGGGLHRNESALAAARREMHEELGLRDLAFEPLTTIELELVHRRVTIAVSRAELADSVLDPDPVEIADARFFRHDALPAPLGEEVEPLVALAFGGRMPPRAQHE